MKKGQSIVGHIPRKILATCSLFLRIGNGSITSTITGKRWYSKDLCCVWRVKVYPQPNMLCVSLMKSGKKKTYSCYCGRAYRLFYCLNNPDRKIIHEGLEFILHSHNSVHKCGGSRIIFPFFKTNDALYFQLVVQPYEHTDHSSLDCRHLYTRIRLNCHLIMIAALKVIS